MSSGAARAGLDTSPAPVDLARRVRAACPAGAGWQIDEDDPWLLIDHGEAATPEQGWKLHVSATPTNAHAVLDAVLDVLSQEPVSFKVLSSIEHLATFNRGEAGRSQVGKFVTVFPDDGQVVRLAVSLDRATESMRGPRVPSDRPLRPGSLVSYRYGAFAGRWMQTPIGLVTPALVAPDGSLVPDDRGRMYRAPAWAEDPFEAAGVVVDPAPPSLVVRGRYLLATVFNSTAEGSVHLAVDLVGGERCVVKRARGDAGALPALDPAERLRHEADLMDRLADEPAVPQLVEVFTEAEDTYLVMEHVAGRSLEDVVYEAAREGRHLATDEVIGYGAATAEVVGRLHRRGLVHGDLKPPHVFAVDDGVRLVDVESLRAPGTTGMQEAVGTPGYASPQRLTGQPLGVADDVHSFGAVLYFLLTATEPSQSPDRRDVLGRPVALLRPDAPPDLVALVHRCLAPDAADRPASMDDIATELRRVRIDAVPVERTTSAQDPERWLDAARRLARQICDRAVPAPGGRAGLVWSTGSDGQPVPRDLGDGVAGTILALAEVADELGDGRVHDTLDAAVAWLVDSEPLPGGPLPGLYVGEAGIAAATLRTGRTLGDPTLIERALERAKLVAGLAHTSPDLYNGTAGRARFHLLVWQATGDPTNRVHALDAAEELAAGADVSADGLIRWPIPAGHEGPDEREYYGYAHGTAGIADVLIDVVRLTGDDSYVPLVESAVTTLLATAQPVDQVGVACDWLDRPDGDRIQPLWCHGGGGIGRFLERAGRLLDHDGAWAAAREARRRVGALRIVGPSQCHGLAGSIELLLDAADHDTEAASAAQELGRLLECFLVPADDLVPHSPLALRDDDLMTGRAGVMRCFARLARPERLGSLLALDEDAAP